MPPATEPATAEAVRPGRRLDGLRDAAGDRAARIGASRLPVAAWTVFTLAGLAALVAAMVPVGPTWLPDAGAVTVSTTYAWALAARTGGRPLVFGTLALVLGLVVVTVGSETLRTGAAVLTCSAAAVLAVMVTVPAVRYWQAAREAVVAVLVAAGGALATIGFEPATTVVRFEYTTLGLALLGALGLVYRLGAGLHGLGRRGLAIVVTGGLLVAITIAYGELLRRYGATGAVEQGLDAVRWSRENLGAFPRPVLTVLGVPALVWGCHMRARRRQGWWVCVFGVAATASVAHGLVNPAVSLTEALLSVAYGLLVGLLVGGLLVRLDAKVSAPGPGRRSSGGRRSRVAETVVAVRPEPPRRAPLL